MKIIVPLAGPDFEIDEARVKGEILIDGKPLLRRALDSRSWCGDAASGDYVFILRDTSLSRHFANTCLAEWYPGSRMVFLSDLTAGAAMTALAGLSVIAQVNEPVCVDLADILYETQARPDHVLIESRGAVGAVGLHFTSDSPVYSYLEMDADGYVMRTAEKRVISNNASAGTYWFDGPATLLRSVAHALDDREQQTFAGRFFVCPLFNGVVAEGKKVLSASVDEVQDIKLA